MDRTKCIDRRIFIKEAGLLALPGVAPQLLFGRDVNISGRKVRLTIETDGPARLEVRGSGDDNVSTRRGPDGSYRQP